MLDPAFLYFSVKCTDQLLQLSHLSSLCIDPSSRPRTAGPRVCGPMILACSHVGAPNVGSAPPPTRGLEPWISRSSIMTSKGHRYEIPLLLTIPDSTRHKCRGPVRLAESREPTFHDELLNSCTQAQHAAPGLPCLDDDGVGIRPRGRRGVGPCARLCPSCNVHHDVTCGFKCHDRDAPWVEADIVYCTWT